METNNNDELWGKRQNSTSSNIEQIRRRYDAIEKLKIEIYDLRESLEEAKIRAEQLRDMVDEERTDSEDFNELVEKLRMADGEVIGIKETIKIKMLELEKLQHPRKKIDMPSYTGDSERYDPDHDMPDFGDIDD